MLELRALLHRLRHGPVKSWLHGKSAAGFAIIALMGSDVQRCGCGELVVIANGLRIGERECPAFELRARRAAAKLPRARVVLPR